VHGNYSTKCFEIGQDSAEVFTALSLTGASKSMTDLVGRALKRIKSKEITVYEYVLWDDGRIGDWVHGEEKAIKQKIVRCFEGPYTIQHSRRSDRISMLLTNVKRWTGNKSIDTSTFVVDIEGRVTHQRDM